MSRVERLLASYWDISAGRLQVPLPVIVFVAFVISALIVEFISHAEVATMILGSFAFLSGGLALASALLSHDRLVRECQERRGQDDNEA